MKTIVRSDIITDVKVFNITVSRQATLAFKADKIVKNRLDVYANSFTFIDAYMTSPILADDLGTLFINITGSLTMLNSSFVNTAVAMIVQPNTLYVDSNSVFKYHTSLRLNVGYNMFMDGLIEQNDPTLLPPNDDSSSIVMIYAGDVTKDDSGKDTQITYLDPIPDPVDYYSQPRMLVSDDTEFALPR